MARQDLWTRDQLLLALRLYLHTPFGKLYATYPDIVRLASQIGRTPGALAMKAVNFANLDPAQQARGIRGLSNSSNADRAIWNEFADNSEVLAAEAEEAASRLDPGSRSPDESAEESPDGINPAPLRLPTGETQVDRLIRARRVQSFFRAAVLTTYQSRCALSGLASPALLTASHIIPWSASVEKRAHPTNGICLNALFDRAFDRGLFTLDDNYRVIVSDRLKEATTDARMVCSLDQIHGQTIQLPKRFPPDVGAIRWHRENVFTR